MNRVRKSIPNILASLPIQSRSWIHSESSHTPQKKKKKKRIEAFLEELKCGQWNEGHTRKFGLLQLVAKWHCCNVRSPLLCYRRRRWRAAGNKGRSCLLCYGEYLKGSAKNKKLTTWKKERGKWTKKAMANI